jgi:hypothetical protein
MKDVETWVLCDVPQQNMAVTIAAICAQYIKQTTGADQRLLLADWEVT